MFVRAYLRASTSDQDATRARAQLEAFAADRGLTIARLVHRERERREACQAGAVSPAGRQPARRCHLDRAGRSAVAPDRIRLAEAQGRDRRAPLPHRGARPADIVGHDDRQRRRVHRAHVRCDQRHALGHARGHCPQGLRRSPPPAGTRSGQGQAKVASRLRAPMS
jgi:hypothetical protein